YDYLNGGTFTATGAGQSMTLQPGEFHVYLNRNLINAVVTPVSNNNTPGIDLLASVYPNPAQANTVLDVDVPQTGKVQVDLLNNLGQKVTTVFSGNLSRGKHRLTLSDKINNLPAGTYLLNIQAGNKTKPVKLVIQ
ncbi:MAG TPA: T9SS type A sorting domain-containing protein, partial [Ignavibacteria bacterium]|nr:T9SS type A sorting domain-containing protein [Ignavibacteria bacterium]